MRQRKFDNVLCNSKSIIMKVRSGKYQTHSLAQISSGYKILKEKLEDMIEVRGKVIATRLSPMDLEAT